MPEGWTGITPVRIIDPLGTQAAWIAPVRGGSLAGWFARHSPREAWEQVLGGQQGQAGIEVLAARDIGTDLVPITDLVSRWRFEERDPTAVRVGGAFDGALWEISYCCDDVLQVHLEGGHTARIGLRLRFLPDALELAEETGAGGRVRVRAGGIDGVSWWHDAGQESIFGRETGGGWQLDVLSAAGARSVVNLTVEAHTNS